MATIGISQSALPIIVVSEATSLCALRKARSSTGAITESCRFLGVEEKDAIALARKSIGLEGGTQVSAFRVTRLDQPGQWYYLLVFGEPEATLALASVNGTSGELENWVRTSGTRGHVEVGAPRLCDAGLGDLPAILGVRDGPVDWPHTPPTRSSTNLMLDLRIFRSVSFPLTSRTEPVILLSAITEVVAHHLFPLERLSETGANMQRACILIVGKLLFPHAHVITPQRSTALLVTLVVATLLVQLLFPLSNF